MYKTLGISNLQFHLQILSFRFKFVFLSLSVHFIVFFGNKIRFIIRISLKM